MIKNLQEVMKVDMSPEAVTSRLRTMDELWLLSIKLMTSKKVESTDVEVQSGNAGEVRAENIRHSGGYLHEAYPKGK